MSKKSKDPFYKREREKYAEPIPSREYIMEILDEYGRPMSRSKLFDKLDLSSESQQESLGFRLKAMLRDGQIMQDRRGRFCLLQKINLLRGTVQGHPDGFGFFIPDDGSEDMVLSAKEMRAVMHGDLVLAYQSGLDRRGRPEAKIHEVLEHANTTVVGRFFTDHGVNFVIPDSKRLTQDISIPQEFIGEAKNGQIVLVELIAYPNKRSQAIGRVIHILGEHMAPGMEIQVAIHAHGIPFEWPDDVLAEVGKIPQQISEEQLKGRTDLRNLPFVTIDGEDAKDFDDAVYCYKKPKGGFQLYVAIADVSHYVAKDSALDQEAARRGNSVYFPGKVVPMLPEALSNGVCSLNPHVDRLCMVAELSITQEGKISRSRFYRAVIHSHARLTYTSVGAWLEQGKADEKHQALWPMLESLYDLYHVLLDTRRLRGAMDFETTETRIEFDENKKIKCIVPVIRNDAHKLIEECMLAANVATARFLEKAEIPTLYRVHAAPEEDKITALRQFLGELGLSLGGGRKPGPKDFQRTMNMIGDRPEKHLIETVMLRSLKQAQYVESNEGHFGLAYSAYTHFTSPIRRFPDLLIHRAIGHILDNHPIYEFEYSHEDMNRLGKHSSMTERRADEATREVITWLKCEYMQDKLGQVFKGRISAVTSFGIFVELDEIYVEGLVHVTSLKNDYYTFDSAKHRLIGARGGQVYRLGDKMTVLVARVDLNERKIDFEPVEDEVCNE
ncbi:TPA: ribonuclease R [Legionella pneumophila subsp. pneumophila]|uniref:Ribonuclease R n=1 Tax=Legionella pneumophila (strain Lens) TaxID=297245 RepID=Q5X0C9_LEGPL|nr:ribonuclease R [Legionella pneumophila]AOW53170.1 ribonuclease R [Legionella pneumophila subsp. pneumophila]AOW55930.1 ribonuclease R [Legionella pneumophila subsp. pneumophila]AOW58512.1 ribonuclease R [Legionella pneumophila subsp. pneumophila]AOW61302.1 ribonuclease R [Legionella pneumophila subsp. pneumophila]AOW63968.1 ribonuclease R [Legionella pneumophila subsp. pneumophila]